MEAIDSIVFAHNLQIVQRNLETVHAKSTDFWPKHDPNPNPSQIMQHNMQTVQIDKMCATS